MDFEFGFDRGTGLLKVTVSGAVDGAGLIKLGMITGEVNARVHPKSVVYDFSGVTSVELPTTQMDSLAHLRPVLPREALQVILAPKDYLYGLGRMFQAMAAETRPSVHVVRSWGEAERLLGLSGPPDLDPVET